jgi:hypothetical protein
MNAIETSTTSDYIQILEWLSWDVLMHPGKIEYALHRAGKLPLHEIQKILQNEGLDYYFRYSLAQKITNPTWEHVWEIVLDESINEIIRLDILRKIKKIEWDQIKDILILNTVDWQIRNVIAMKVNWVNLECVQSIFPILNTQLVGPTILQTLHTRIKKMKNERRVEENEERLEVEYEHDIPSWFKFYPAHKRCTNAKRINAWQLAKIFPERTYEMEAEPERTLVFYYREHQWAYEPHYFAMIWCLQEYISSGKSQVYTNFCVVCRHWFTVDKLQKEFKDVPILHDRNVWFREQTTLFADTIHLNHGSLEKTPGTRPIVWRAIATDTYKTSKFPIWEKYTEIDLLYYGGENEDIVRANTHDKWRGYPNDITVDEICIRILQAVRRNEDSLLEEIQSTRWLRRYMQDRLQKILSVPWWKKKWK